MDRNHNRYKAPFAKPNPRLLAAELRLMDQPPYEMDEPRRQAVLESIADRCARHDWQLRAAHVRGNHVHVIVQAVDAPEYVMTELKCGSSRRLNHLGFDHPVRKRWPVMGARGGCLTTKAFNERFGMSWRAKAKLCPLFNADRSRRSRF